MRVLIVCSGTEGFISPFIKEQMVSLMHLGINIELFKITKKGARGYLSQVFPFIQFIKQFNPDIIHAHYGLSGLFANLQRIVPVITTFHGCDISNKQILKFSKIANYLSVGSIFVNKPMMNKLTQKEHAFNIPCGVDTSVFYPIPLTDARKSMGIGLNEIVILFSSYFNNPVKNYPLAQKACADLERVLNREVRIIELKGYDRSAVNLLMNSADCALLTSFSEGSPQFVKEAMACNCPIVSTNVGDVEWLFGETEGCHICDYDSGKIAERIKDVLNFGQRTKGRNRVIELGLDNVSVAHKLLKVYTKILSH